MLTDCYELLASPSTRSRDSPLIQRPPQQLKPAVLLSLTPLLLSLGNTLVHCRASLRPSNQQRCSIDCSVSYAPQVEASSLLLPSETHLAQQVSDALEETILLESYSKNAVSLQLLFLRADGGLLSAAILAASLSMVFAALEVKCLVAPIDLAVVRKKKNKEEESAATVLLTPDAAESAVCSSSLHISKACYYSGSSNNDGGKGRGRFSQIVFEGRASRTELEQYLLLGEASADARLANITMLLKGL